ALNSGTLKTCRLSVFVSAASQSPSTGPIPPTSLSSWRRQGYGYGSGRLTVTFYLQRPTSLPLLRLQTIRFSPTFVISVWPTTALSHKTTSSQPISPPSAPSPSMPVQILL